MAIENYVSNYFWYIKLVDSINIFYCRPPGVRKVLKNNNNLNKCVVRLVLKLN